MSSNRLPRNAYQRPYYHLNDEEPINTSCIKFKACSFGLLIGGGLGFTAAWLLFTKPWEHSSDNNDIVQQPTFNTTLAYSNNTLICPPTQPNYVCPPTGYHLAVNDPAEKSNLRQKHQAYKESAHINLNIFPKPNHHAKLEKLRGGNIQNNYQKKMNHR